MRFTSSLIRLSRPLFLFGCLAALTSCATKDDYGGPHIKATMQKELYVHAPSQFRFPPTVASFNRGSAYAHGPQKSLVSVGYLNESAGVSIMVEVFPTRYFPRALADYYAQRRDELPARYPSAKRVSEDQADIAPNGIPRRGLHATFTFTDYFQGDLRPLVSELFAFSAADHYITYRFTYRADRLMVAKPPMQAFMNELAWPTPETRATPPQQTNIASHRLP